MNKNWLACCNATVSLHYTCIKHFIICSRIHLTQLQSIKLQSLTSYWILVLHVVLCSIKLSVVIGMFLFFFNPSYFWHSSPILSLQLFELTAFSYWCIFLCLHCTWSDHLFNLSVCSGWFVVKFYVFLTGSTAVVEGARLFKLLCFMCCFAYWVITLVHLLPCVYSVAHFCVF